MAFKPFEMVDRILMVNQVVKVLSVLRPNKNVSRKRQESQSESMFIEAPPDMEMLDGSWIMTTLICKKIIKYICWGKIS